MQKGAQVGRGDGGLVAESRRGEGGKAGRRDRQADRHPHPLQRRPRGSDHTRDGAAVDAARRPSTAKNASPGRSDSHPRPIPSSAHRASSHRSTEGSDRLSPAASRADSGIRTQATFIYEHMFVYTEDGTGLAIEDHARHLGAEVGRERELDEFWQQLLEPLGPFQHDLLVEGPEDPSYNRLLEKLW